MATTIDVRGTQHVRVAAADLVDGRNWLSDFEKQGVAALPPLSPSLQEFYSDIPTSDGWLSRCKIIKPNPDANRVDGLKRWPLIVYFFGGGFGMGCPEQVTRPAREWAEEHHATVVLPDYRLAPEHPWPQGVKDGWDVISYLSRHAESDSRFGNINLRDGFIVGGVSAGGGIAGVAGGISVLHEADPECKLDPVAEKLAKPITGIFLSVPLIGHEDMIPPSYRRFYTAWEDNAHDPAMNTANIMRTFREIHCTNYKSPWFSPINVLERTLPEPTNTSRPRLKITQHPLVYLQACGKDPVRDDAVVYHRMLKDLGFAERTKIDIHQDDGHASWSALPFDESKSKSPTIKEALLHGMRWLVKG